MNKPQEKTDDNVLAYHEAGHIVTKVLKPGFYDFTSATIASDGETQGSFKVKKIIDMDKASKEMLTNEMITLMGGCAAEQLLFNKQTYPLEETSDFHKAYQTASCYIEKYGIADDPIAAFSPQKEKKFSFLSGIIDHFKKTEPPTERDIEQAKFDLIQEAYNQSYYLLEDNRKALDATAKILLDHKEINKEQAVNAVKTNLPEYTETHTYY